MTENMKNPVTGEVEGFTVLEQLDLQQIIRARKGDTRSYELILDRLEGKPKQTLDATVKGSVDVSVPKTAETLLKLAATVLQNAKASNSTSSETPQTPVDTTAPIEPEK
jgi:hypothetical protein